MKPEQTELTDLLADLRQTFDQSFATMPVDRSETSERFLTIGIGGDYYALRLTEISALVADKEVVHLPSRTADLLGIVSFRGVILPVYDLGSLLGYPPAGAMPRWLTLIASDTPIGLAFDRLDGYVDVTPEAIAKDIGSEQVRQHIVETIRVDNIIRSVIGTSSILEVIKQWE